MNNNFEKPKSEDTPELQIITNQKPEKESPKFIPDEVIKNYNEDDIGKDYIPPVGHS